MDWKRILRVGLIALLAALLLRVYDTRRVDRLPHPSRPVPTDSDAASRLARHVSTLAEKYGERNLAHQGPLTSAGDYIHAELRRAGYAPQVQRYYVGGAEGIELRNISAVLAGASPTAPVFVVGAHYDSAPGTPGADDNASGAAALIELASRLRRSPGRVELRFVAFSSEEPPFFGSDEMGSGHYAKALKGEGRQVLGMVSLEMLGYYSDEKGSQRYPPLLRFFYPSRGNYIGLVSDIGSRSLLTRFASSLRPPRGTPVVAAALPRLIPEIGYSDHLPFWREGFQALMVTDTAFLRNPNYHQRTDRPETLDYARMADVVDGLEAAILALSR